MTTHWASDYIGQPYVRGEADCWAFCRRVWAERFGLEVPAVEVNGSNLRAITRAISHHPERLLWNPVEIPAEGDAVLMAHNRFPSHVGIWIEADGGGVLHCADPQGVIFTTRAQLAAAGWQALRYYRRAA